MFGQFRKAAFLVAGKTVKALFWVNTEIFSMRRCAVSVRMKATPSGVVSFRIGPFRFPQTSQYLLKETHGAYPCCGGHPVATQSSIAARFQRRRAPSLIGRGIRPASVSREMCFVEQPRRVATARMSRSAGAVTSSPRGACGVSVTTERDTVEPPICDSVVGLANPSPANQ